MKARSSSVEWRVSGTVQCMYHGRRGCEGLIEYGLECRVLELSTNGGACIALVVKGAGVSSWAQGLTAPKGPPWDWHIGSGLEARL